MTTVGRDITATVLAVLTVLVPATAHEGWDVRATGVIVVLCAAMFVVVGSMQAKSGSTLATLTSVAVVPAAAAFASGFLVPLSSLVVAIVVVRVIAVERDLVDVTHHRRTPA